MLYTNILENGIVTINQTCSDIDVPKSNAAALSIQIKKAIEGSSGGFSV